MDAPGEELSGKVAVVTGASRGIGRAIAWELAQAGAHVAVHAWRSRKEAEDLSEEIRELGRESTVLLGDLRDQDFLEEFSRKAWDWRDAVDIWVNNAGVDLLTGTAPQWSYEYKFHALWDVDVHATVVLTRAIGFRMKARGRGTILTMGWDQAATGMAGDSGELFATAKGAVMAFTKSVALSLAPEVRVNCLAPGWIRTAWGAQASPSWQARAIRESALARWGTPEDVARAARFLVSPAASFLTGHILPINGGFKPS